MFATFRVSVRIYENCRMHHVCLTRVQAPESFATLAFSALPVDTVDNGCEIGIVNLNSFSSHQYLKFAINTKFWKWHREGAFPFFFQVGFIDRGVMHGKLQFSKQNSKLLPCVYTPLKTKYPKSQKTTFFCVRIKPQSGVSSHCFNLNSRYAPPPRDCFEFRPHGGLGVDTFGTKGINTSHKFHD